MRGMTKLGAAVLVVVGGGYLAFNLFDGSGPDEAVVAGPHVVGDCGAERYTAYREISDELSDIAAGQSPDFKDPEARSKILALIRDEGFRPATTYYLVGHGPTQELFVSSCAERKCEISEMVAAEEACLRKHARDCSIVAAVDDMKIYCLIAE